MRTLILLSLLFSIPAGAASIEEDVQRNIAMFKGDTVTHPIVAEALGWTGLSDPRLFDVIEQRLLKDYPAPADNRLEKQRLAWYIRALGFSGDAKYLPTINRFREYRDTAVYAKHALVDMPDYRRWNPIISDRTSFDPKLSDDENRVVNMLRGGDFSLKRLGAKRVHYETMRNKQVLDVLAEELRAGYPKAAMDKNSDPVAWMVRALGAAKQEKYKPLLREVLANTTVPAVQGHARQAVDNYAR
jgi:hypothetical protein